MLPQRGRCHPLMKLYSSRRATQGLEFRGGGMEGNRKANIDRFMKTKTKR